MSFSVTDVDLIANRSLNHQAVFSLNRHFAFIFVFASYLCVAQSSQAETNVLAAVQQQAQQLKLAEHPQWQAFLHSQNGESLIKDDSFFLAANGAKDNAAELNATLAAFFQNEINDDNSAQCRFPARFSWLQQQLQLKNYLPEHRCQKLQDWLKNLAVTGVTLVFPVAYLNNPASMFGHSFLRLDSESKNNELLAWTVNYAAVTEQERGVIFAAKGLFGGYAGQYSLNPYYVLLKEYADLESRDLWEYALNFSSSERQRLLLHLWEIKDAHFAYYFINKNCSYQLLTLLEAARPDLNLSQQFVWDAIPADTVRAVVNVPHLLKKITYRPALATQISTKAKVLDDAQQNLAKALATSEITPDSVSIKNYPLSAQAKILELAFAYLSYLNADKIKRNQVLDGQLAYRLLTARSFLPTIDTEKIAQPEFRPDQSHAGNRLQVVTGYDGNAAYTQLGWRWSYHDLYDPGEGFIKGSQVEFFKPAIRYYPQQPRLSFEGVDLININSISASNSFIQPVSWQVDLAINRQRFPNRQRYLMGAAKVGSGFSYLDEQTLLSASALTSLLISPKFHQNFAVGFGASVVGQYDFSTRWRIGAEAMLMRYVQGITHTVYNYGVIQRFSLAQNQALLLGVERSNEFERAAIKAQLTWQVYF